MNPKTLKSNAFKRFERLLLIICLCLLAFRATYTETTITALTNPDAILGNHAFSLIVSTILLFAVVAWLVISLLQKQFIYRKTGMEIGLAIFIVAGLIATAAASNKRAAIIDMTTLIAPVFMAILLVQILDTPAKIKLVLIAVVALAVTSGYQCVEQLLTSNENMIEDYQQDQNRHLSPLGIEPGSLNHFMYEHRLYSKDTRGFLTTSNSTGSFVILAIFASTALCLEKFKNRSSALSLISSIAIVIITIACLVLTFSKGAIVAAIFAAIILIALLAFGKLINRHRKPILIVILLLICIAAALVIDYGLTHDRLPGGNSMLVRWQYWHSAAKMYMLKPFTGIGPGNFAGYYPAFKNPAAIETVRDPHNIILSLLTQYGPLGLAGFATIILLPLIRLCKKIPLPQPQTINAAPKNRINTAALISIVITLLILRPIALANSYGDRIDVMIYVFFVLYVLPACVFILAFYFLNSNEKRCPSTTQLPPANILALCVGLIAVLIHNLIDYALFEPAVLTAFFAVLATIIAASSSATEHDRSIHNLNPKTKLAMITLLVVLTWLHISLSLTPTVNASAKIQMANRRPDIALRLLKQASEIDPLTPDALHSCGISLLWQSRQTSSPSTQLLESAADCFTRATKTDHADYRNYEKTASAYKLLAENSTGKTKQNWTQKSFDACKLAVEHYPGSGMLHFKLAQTAEQLQDNKLALNHYQTAVNIEDAFRNQFRIMYPGTEVFSRLQRENYELAKEKIEKLKPLSEQLTPRSD